jgi:purine-binding chemotaxis protein CheW
MRTAAEARADARQYATFTVDEMFFGIDVRKVQEVLRYQTMTPVPRAARTVEGLINLRGQIVTALDMRRRLGAAERPAGREPMNVVVRNDDGAVSLLVDEIGDVIEIDAEQFEAPPETISATAREMVDGVYKLPGRLLLVLAAERVLNG